MSHDAPQLQPEPEPELELEQPRRRDPQSLRRISWIILLVTVLGAIGWTAYSANRLKNEALAAVEPLRLLEASPSELDSDRRLLENSAFHARQARAAADALPMRLARFLPFVGDDVESARILVTALDNVVAKAGVPLVDVAAQALDVPKAKPGQPAPLVNTKALAGLTPKVEAAAAAVHTAHEELSAINASAIVDQLSLPVTQATTIMATADSALQQARTMSPIITDAVGTQGAKDYLLVFQNLAEARPTGGLFGKWALIRVNNGALQLLDIGANENLVDVSLKSLPPLEPDFLKLYKASLGPVANDNLTPHFPDAARLLLASWTQQGRKAPAGVVSVDTNAIAGLLGLTGSLTVNSPGLPNTVVVDQSNVVNIVQSEVYDWFQGREPERQAFLSLLTTQMMAELSSGNVPLRNLATTLQQLVENRSVMAYFTDAKAQASLVELGAAGALPAPTKTSALMFVTDNGGSKLDHYLRVRTCTSANQLGTSLTNGINPTAPVTDYILNHVTGLNPRDNALTVAFYIPNGRGVSQVKVNGKVVSFEAGTERHWSVVRVPIKVPAGQTWTVTVQLTEKGTKPKLTTQQLTRSVGALNGVCR